jgi:arylsulfatase
MDIRVRSEEGMAGSDAIAPELGWRGPGEHIATVPAIYDLWQDPQERNDVFMNSLTEKTWMIIGFNKVVADLMQTYVTDPPRKLQSETYTGPLTIERYRKLSELKWELKA